MDIDWNAEVVDQMDSHWRNQFRPRLEGLTDDEYFWEPVAGCWSLRRRGVGTSPSSPNSGKFIMDYAEPPYEREPVTTIAWRLAHLIDVLGPPGAPHFTVESSDLSSIEYPGTAVDALRQLDGAYKAWIPDVRSLGVSGLARPKGPCRPHRLRTPPSRGRSCTATSS